MPYEGNLNSLNARPLPQWYDDAKFGTFIHVSHTHLTLPTTHSL